MQYLIKYGITKYFESVSYMSRGTEIVYIKFVLKCLKYACLIFVFLFLFDICTLAFFNKRQFRQEYHWSSFLFPINSSWISQHEWYLCFYGDLRSTLLVSSLIQHAKTFTGEKMIQIQNVCQTWSTKWLLRRKTV